MKNVTKKVKETLENTNNEINYRGGNIMKKEINEMTREELLASNPTTEELIAWGKNEEIMAAEADLNLHIDEIVKKHFKFHSEMTYDLTRCTFSDLKKWCGTISGVYLFLVRWPDGTVTYEKFGKGEGAKGMGRLNAYSGLGINKMKTCAGTRLINRAMTGELKGCTIEVWTKECPSITEFRDGVMVPHEWARGYEETLSRKAEAAGHPLRLSGNAH